MKTWLFWVAATAVVVSCHAQTITFQAPISSTYLDALTVAWTVTPSTQMITRWNLSLTYSSGYFSYISPAPFWNFLLVSNATQASFSFAPFTVNPPDSNFVTWTGSALPMLDGTYTAKLILTRSDGVALNSVVTTPTVNLYTLQPIVSSPISGSTLGRFINVTYNLYRSARTSGFPVSLTMTDVSTGDTVAQMTLSTVLANTFVLDTANLTNFTTGVRNISTAYSPTLPDGTYNITVISIDNLYHPPNSTTISNVIVQTATPVPVLYTPYSGDSDVFSMSFGLFINYSIPVLASGFGMLTLVQSGVIFNNVPTTPTGEPLIYNVPLSTPGICTCNETFVLSYSDSIGNAAASTSSFGLIDIVSLPASFLSLHDGSLVFPVDGLNLSYALGEPCSTIQFTFITYSTDGTLFRCDVYFNGSLSALNQAYLWDGSMNGNGDPFVSANATGAATELLANQTYNVYLSVSDLYGNPLTTTTLQLVSYFGSGYMPTPPPTTAPAPTAPPRVSPTPAPTNSPAPTSAPTATPAPTAVVTQAPSLPHPIFPTLAPVATPTVPPTVAPAPTPAPTKAPLSAPAPASPPSPEANLSTTLQGTGLPIYAWIILSVSCGVILTAISVLLWLCLCPGPWSYHSVQS